MPDPTPRPGETAPEEFTANPPPSLRRIIPPGLPARLRKLAADQALLRCHPA